MHLDIKSDNLLVSNEGTITLIDFGKIGFVGDNSIHRKGSHQTMSPEQRSHWHLTPKSDVYSLAVTVYQAFLHTTVPFASIGQPYYILLKHSPEMEQRVLQDSSNNASTSFLPNVRLCSSFIKPCADCKPVSIAVNIFPLTETYIGNHPNFMGKKLYPRWTYREW